MKLDIFKSLREREKKITRLHIILFVLAIIVVSVVVVTIRYNNYKTVEKYKKLEKDLNIAAKYYYKDKASELAKGQQVIISMKTIIDNGYLQDELTKKCDGYTIIGNYRGLNGKFELGYLSYIKCGNSYETYNFEEKYAK